MEMDVIEPDYYYHIYNRGINRQSIFYNDKHYIKFLKLCEKYLPKCADTIAYCLIPNHFHFLLYMHEDCSYPNGPPKKGCYNPLGVLFNSYAQWFNNSSNRTGGLFQSPFKRKRITTQKYLKRVIYYIHRNPLHHGLTENPAEYKYSSYQYFIEPGNSFIKRDFVLELFDGPNHFADFHKKKFRFDSTEYFDD